MPCRPSKLTRAALQDEIEHLSKLQSIDQRQTVDERDTFTRRLNYMLSSKGAQSSFPTTWQSVIIMIWMVGGNASSKVALPASSETAVMVVPFVAGLTAALLFFPPKMVIPCFVCWVAQKKMQSVQDGLEADQGQTDERRGRTILKLEEVRYQEMCHHASPCFCLLLAVGEYC